MPKNGAKDGHQDGTLALSDAGDIAMHVELAGNAGHAIYLLPPHLRDVILLRDMAELPYGKVAAMLNIRGGTARLYRHQAVLRLGGLLGEEAAK